MNKVAYLKLLIGVITFLIFLTMGGIVYGLLNYKSTPKLITGRNKSAATVDGAPVVRLNLTAGKDQSRPALRRNAVSARRIRFRRRRHHRVRSRATAGSRRYPRERRAANGEKGKDRRFRKISVGKGFRPSEPRSVFIRASGRGRGFAG